MRRPLFLGLTLILLVIFIFLLLRGRNASGPEVVRTGEVIEQVEDEPAPTRDLTPRELTLENVQTTWTRQAATQPALPSAATAAAVDSTIGADTPGKDQAVATESVTAHHRLTVRNGGAVDFRSLRLRLEYRDKRGRSLVTRIEQIDEPLPARGTLNLTDLAVAALPVTATDCRITIISADLL